MTEKRKVPSDVRKNHQNVKSWKIFYSKNKNQEGVEKCIAQLSEIETEWPELVYIRTK